MKNVIVKLDIQNGEYTHSHLGMIEVTENASVDDVSKLSVLFAKNFYDDNNSYQKDDWYYFFSGCIAVRVRSFHFITSITAHELKHII